MKGLRNHAFIVSQETYEEADCCQVSAVEATETGMDISFSIQACCADLGSWQLGGWRLRADTVIVAARRPHFWCRRPHPHPPVVVETEPCCFSSDFPASWTGSVAPSHCLALQKEPEQRREARRGEEGEEEMTAAGQEREHDKGKSQREVAAELWRRVGGNVRDGRLEMCWLFLWSS